MESFIEKGFNRRLVVKNKFLYANPNRQRPKFNVFITVPSFSVHRNKFMPMPLVINYLLIVLLNIFFRN